MGTIRTAENARAFSLTSFERARRQGRILAASVQGDPCVLPAHERDEPRAELRVRAERSDCGELQVAIVLRNAEDVPPDPHLSRLRQAEVAFDTFEPLELGVANVIWMRPPADVDTHLHERTVGAFPCGSRQHGESSASAGGACSQFCEMKNE